MYMIKKETILSIIIICLGLSNVSCKENKYQLFENVFDNISLSPDKYLNEKNYRYNIIKQEDGNFPSYAKSYGCNSITEISNDAIKISYWNISVDYQIQYVIISKKTNLHYLSSFIDKELNDVIQYFSENKEYEISKKTLRYTSEDWLYFIQFNCVNNKINQITIGRNL